MGILDSIVEWIATQVMNLLDLITGSVLGALGCDMSTFLRYFPAAETLYEIFVAIGVGFILLNLVWQLFRNFGLGLGLSAEDPVKLAIKSILFIFLALFADQIMVLVLGIVGTPYDWVVDTALPPIEFASFASVVTVLVGSLVSGSVSLIVLILVLIVAWNYMGLNLNYTPNRLVDITTLTEDQWLSWRRKGIGGSDVAVALNSSPYRTARDLYYDKIGVVMSDDGPDKSITFQIGHLLEDVVAQIFAKKTGLSVYEDHWMYQHPFFPFLIADVDRFVTLPDGRKAILECKTAHYDMQFKWANGAVPRHYELQVRHYMSVMNIDVAFIACLFSNNENDFVWQKIERDLEEEENTIMELSAFWNNHVMARVEPPLVEKPDAVLESLRRYFGPADKSEPTVDLDRKFVVNLKEILTLKEEKRALDAQVKALETRIKSLYAPIVEEMGTACKGTCEQGGECFKVSYNPLYREGISKDRLSALRAQYPDIYDEFVDQTESRIFKVVKSAIA